MKPDYKSLSRKIYDEAYQIYGRSGDRHKASELIEAELKKQPTKKKKRIPSKHQAEDYGLGIRRTEHPATKTDLGNLRREDIKAWIAGYRAAKREMRKK